MCFKFVSNTIIWQAVRTFLSIAFQIFAPLSSSSSCSQQVTRFLLLATDTDTKTERRTRGLPWAKLRLCWGQFRTLRGLLRKEEDRDHIRSGGVFGHQSTNRPEPTWALIRSRGWLPPSTWRKPTRSMFSQWTGITWRSPELPTGMYNFLYFTFIMGIIFWRLDLV